MFCPKCGSQNVDGTKFCRGCGADVSNVLAVIDGKPLQILPIAEKQIELYSRGLAGLLIGLGFFVVSGISFAISTRFAVLGVFALAFAFFFFGMGISRLVQSKRLRQLTELKPEPTAPSLTPGETDYIKPSRSIYETDDLLTAPHSITENTTTHLEMGPEAEQFGSSKK